MSQNHLPNMPEKMVLITSQHNHWLQSTDLNFIKGLLLCSFSVIFWLKCMYTPIYNIKIKMNKWIFIILWVTNQLNIPACGSTSSTMLTDSWKSHYLCALQMCVRSTKIGSCDLQNRQPSAHSDRKALGWQNDFTEGQNPARHQGASGSYLGVKTLERDIWAFQSSHLFEADVKTKA